MGKRSDCPFKFVVEVYGRTKLIELSYHATIAI
jgi:hypothetical protein